MQATCRVCGEMRDYGKSAKFGKFDLHLTVIAPYNKSAEEGVSSTRPGLTETTTCRGDRQ